MKVNDILKLLDAGYTRDEIAKMSDADETIENNVAEAPAVNETTAATISEKSELELLVEQVSALTKIVMESKKEPEKPVEVEVAKPATEPDSKIMEEIKKMREAMQASNIINSNQTQPMSSDDVISSLINGNKKEVK